MKVFWLISYWVYRSGSGSLYWIRRRFTSAGLMIVLGMMVAGLMGPDTENNVSYQAFAFLAGLVLLGICFSWFYRGKFSVKRVAPRFGTAGSVLSYRVLVKNLTAKLQTGITLLEDLEDPRPPFRQWRAARMAEDRRTRSFRVIGRKPRNSLRMATLSNATVPPVPPNQEVEARVELTPLRRGVLRFVGITVARSDPLGIFRAFSKIAAPQSILVLPKRYPLPPIELPGSMRFQAGGIALASNVGQSDEFVSLRDYRHGDPIRHIHWRSWAKTGKPVVKEFEDEFFVRHALVLDTFTALPNSDVFEEAVSIAASFACSIRTQESLLDLLFVGPESYCFTAGRGLGRSEQMLEILAAVQPCADRSFDQLQQMVIEHVRLVSGCICVLVDWDQPRQQFVQRIKALGVPVLVLLVVQSGESKTPDPGPMSDALDQFHVIETGNVEIGLARMQ